MSGGGILGAVKAIPIPVRERILYLYDQGRKTKEIASSLGYCVAAIRRVRQHFKLRGTLQPETYKCGRKSELTARRKSRLQALLALHPDATLAELGARLKRPTSTIDLWLNRMGLSCKKNATRSRAVAARRSRGKKAVAAAVGRRGGTEPGVPG